jgi:hypothetical protein
MALALRHSDSRLTKFAVRVNQRLKIERAIQAAWIRQHPDLGTSEAMRLFSPGNVALIEQRGKSRLAKERQITRAVTLDRPFKCFGPASKFISPYFTRLYRWSLHRSRQATSGLQNRSIV